MRRVNVRQRPLQSTKRIRVYHLSVDGSFISDNGDRIPAGAGELEDCSPEKTSFLNKARISIPKPPIRTIPNYDAEVSHSFKRSNGFIKYIPLTLEEEANRVEYNLDHNDEIWLLNHKVYGESAPESQKISLDLFERMLDCTDKFCGEHKMEPTADILETLFIQKLQFSRVDSHEVCKQVLDYWRKKRKELGKPLLRRYWPLTNVNDTNPNLVFRPRCKDEHYRLRKKSKPNEEILERLLEMRGNLEHARQLCNLVHEREQLKLRSLFINYETVVEVHYLLTNHSGPRSLTYNLKDKFVYEGRTTSMLSATSSANAYATFNPVALNPSYGFMDSRFTTDMPSANDELNEFTPLSAPTPVTQVSPEERQYLQLTALSQLGGAFFDGQFIPCETPSVVINQAGNTDTVGTHWLMPVSARNSYEHFYNFAINDSAYCVSSGKRLPQQTRLRSRVGRGKRLIIDRLPENKPLYGSGVHEVYRSSIPITAVRYAPPPPPPPSSSPIKSSANTTFMVELMAGESNGNLPATPANMGYPPLPEFNRSNPVNAGVKRRYQEMMPNETALPSCNLDPLLTFNLASEMVVHVDKVKRLVLTRNSTNDQIQFFL